MEQKAVASIIDKNCRRGGNFRRVFRFFPRARDGFGAILDAEGVVSGDGVMLPAYIGWSPREGSGVFDPIAQRGIRPIFYRIDGELNIDLEDLEAKLESGGRIKAILFIHYFGFVDPHLKAAVAMAKSRGLTVIEDAAHALYTDFALGSCSGYGDYVLYSLHKMLPFAGGGMVAFHGGKQAFGPLQCGFGDPFAYDFAAIAARRRENYRRLQSLLAPLERWLVPLYPELPPGIAPQTFPLKVQGYDRFRLYQQMNGAGYGVVSLYHTLIEPLRTPEWGASQGLSRCILNLPAHQDVDPERYPEMLSVMEGFLRGR